LKRGAETSGSGAGPGRCGNIEHRTSNIEHRTSNAEHRTPNFEVTD
jgi:hypothetical protein